MTREPGVKSGHMSRGRNDTHNTQHLRVTAATPIRDKASVPPHIARLIWGSSISDSYGIFGAFARLRTLHRTLISAQRRTSLWESDRTRSSRRSHACEPRRALVPAPHTSRANREASTHNAALAPFGDNPHEFVAGLADERSAASPCPRAFRNQRCAPIGMSAVPAGGLHEG
jgi:hypothetical protein